MTTMSASPPTTLREIFEGASSIVLKLGTETILKNGGVDESFLAAFAAGIAQLKRKGKEVLIVTSGAIGLGRAKLGIAPEIPTTLLAMPVRQQAATVGQPLLMAAFAAALEAKGFLAGQILLTPDVLGRKKQAAHFRNCTLARGGKGISETVVPVINENDALATAEIKFGDNDRLGAIVARLVKAGLYVIFSDIDGLHTDNPKTNPHAKHIPEVPDIAEARRHVQDNLSGLSSGGMTSKLDAFALATAAQKKGPGTLGILTRGKGNPECLLKLIAGETPRERYTLFLSRPGARETLPS